MAAIVRPSRRLIVVLATAWVALSAAQWGLRFVGGLRGQYFAGAGFAGAPVLRVVDPAISTEQVYHRWRTTPPEAFSVQWSGYLLVTHSGRYTFTTTTDGTVQLFVDDRLVVENVPASDTSGQPSPQNRSGDVELTAGPHKVLLRLEQARGRYLIEWTWARAGEAAGAVPRWTLSTERAEAVPIAVRWLAPAWWAASVACLWLVAVVGLRRFASSHTAGLDWRRLRRAVLLVGVAMVLGWFYYVAAAEHAVRVNQSKARGDQSAWLVDGIQVYANRHGRTPPMLIGQRFRMPLYAGFLSLFYKPTMSDVEYFEEAKLWNIRLSLVLLAALSIVLFRRLPPLPAANLMLVLAFGCFIFKAGYTQPELLLYPLFFWSFLVFCRLLREDVGGWSGLALGGLAGLLAGLTQLTKAVMLPFLGVFAAVFAIREAILFARGKSSARRVVGQAGVLVVMGVCFVVVLYPYIANSKRAFGSYFYHGTTSVLAWYDGAAASLAAVMPNLRPDGRIEIPPEQLPTARTYWRGHSLGQIAERFGDGFADIVVRSYTTYRYFKYVVLYLLVTVALVAANRAAFEELLRGNPALVFFLIAYAVVFLTMTAFFSNTSGTGTTRFLLTHLAPLLFTLSWLQTRPPFAETRWTVAGVELSTVHLQFLITAAIAFDIVFTIWPRLMTTYGGF